MIRLVRRVRAPWKLMFRLPLDLHCEIHVGESNSYPFSPTLIDALVSARIPVVVNLHYDRFYSSEELGQTDARCDRGRHSLHG